MWSYICSFKTPKYSNFSESLTNVSIVHWAQLHMGKCFINSIIITIILINHSTGLSRWKWNIGGSQLPTQHKSCPSYNKDIFEKKNPRLHCFLAHINFSRTSSEMHSPVKHPHKSAGSLGASGDHMLSQIPLHPIQCSLTCQLSPLWTISKQISSKRHQTFPADPWNCNKSITHIN